MYSKITTIEVRNFMCFKHEIASFDEQNILNFKGFNGQGKSAILKAIAVCLMNVYPSDQASFISWGEDYFRIVISFDDGVRILRDKYINGQSLYEMYRNGELIFSTKVGNKLSKVSAVPDTIKNYVGLIEVGNIGTGYLNFQTRREPSWLTETTGSENYTSLNVILKSGEISRASNLINTDRNQLNSELTEIERDKQAVEMNLLTANQYTEKLLNSLKERDREAKALMSRVSSLKELWELSNQIKSLVVSPKVDDVGYERYSDILSISSTLLEIESIPNIPELEKLESERLKLLVEAERSAIAIESIQVQPNVERVSSVTRAEDLSAILNLTKDIQSIPRTVGAEIELLDAVKLKELLELIKSAVDTRKSRKEYSDVIKEMSETSTELTNIVKEASKQGMKFIKCKNCGTYMRVNVEKGGSVSA